MSLPGSRPVDPLRGISGAIRKRKPKTYREFDQAYPRVATAQRRPRPSPEAICEALPLHWPADVQEKIAGNVVAEAKANVLTPTMRVELDYILSKNYSVSDKEASNETVDKRKMPGLMKQVESYARRNVQCLELNTCLDELANDAVFRHAVEEYLLAAMQRRVEAVDNDDDYMHVP